MTTTEYHVTGMSCAHCETAVRNELEQIAGIENLEVSAATGRLMIASSLPLDDDAVRAAVEEAGYSVVRADR